MRIVFFNPSENVDIYRSKAPRLKKPECKFPSDFKGMMRE
ncbi:hypothetical protein C7450_103200 [Chelatococcus asaccharovorans]|uniref:Uncharacterized protein n=1 Tax=Chelatococcus asaccharovorans TaxID=28210 RepID=A0A2V3UCL5_9HYPH|nr:hypothetical protein C7450_103200 [Chelatococcus asaccharovorans]